MHKRSIYSDATTSETEQTYSDSSPERKKRLAENAAITAEKRKMESVMQRQDRLAKDAARTATRRKNESFMDRQKRLEADAARHAYKRAQLKDDSAMELKTKYAPRVGELGKNIPMNIQVYNPEVPPHVVTSHQSPSHQVTSHQVTSHQVSSHQVPSHQVTSHQVTSHQVASHQVASHQVSSHQVTSPPPPPPSAPPVQQQKPRPQTLPMSYQSKYGELLNVIEDLGREIKPTYAGSKMAQERLKKGIMHARALVRECLAEVEKSARQ